MEFGIFSNSRRPFRNQADTWKEDLFEVALADDGFGLLMMHAGRDYATHEKREQSMRLFMDEVAPRLRLRNPDRERSAA